MGQKIEGRGDWTVEARAKTFTLFLLHDREAGEGESITARYSEFPALIDTLTALKDYLVASRRIKPLAANTEEVWQEAER